jgi:hypothetical protein
MNIFILDYDIRTNAYYHCDQHVNKMVLESAQMLCTVAGENNIVVPYKATHPNHPCTKWVRESIDNYIYLLDLAFWLNEAAKERYKRKTDHKSWTILESLDIPRLPELGLTKFARAMPDEFKIMNDTVEAYRAYYKTKEFATWKNAKPSWY